MKPRRTDELLAAIAQLHSGAGSAALEMLWAGLDADDRFCRCVAAHYLADAQTDPREELRWDQLALAAATDASAEEFADAMPGITRASFMPSLHLNLAASYERIGDIARARDHAAAARSTASALPATELGELTRTAIERLAGRLAL
jgi:hypothetical protein